VYYIHVYKTIEAYHKKPLNMIYMLVARLQQEHPSFFWLKICRRNSQLDPSLAGRKKKEKKKKKKRKKKKKKKAQINMN